MSKDVPNTTSIDNFEGIGSDFSEPRRCPNVQNAIQTQALESFILSCFTLFFHTICKNIHCALDGLTIIKGTSVTYFIF